MYNFVLDENLFTSLIYLLKLSNWLYIFIVANMQIYLCTFAWSGTDKRVLFVLEDFNNILFVEEQERKR